MRKGEALPGKYLSKDDFPQETLVTIRKVAMEEIKVVDGPNEHKPVLYFANPSNPTLDTSRGIVLNVGNWDACEAITGELDSDDWPGHDIVVYVDPSVMFGGKMVGGLRIRAPKKTQVQEEPPLPDEEPPF